MIMKQQHEAKIPFAPHQIIIFGPPQRIEQMLGADDGWLKKALHLLARNSFRLPEPPQPRQKSQRGPSHPQPQELRLYRILGDEDDVLAALQKRGQGFDDVIIERNYFTYGIPWTGGGSPWTGGGSPWTGGGSPWTGGGSPWTGGGSPWAAGGSPWTVGSRPWLEMQGQGGEYIRQRAERIFREQWAFGPAGVNARGILNARTPGHEDGGDVVVGVFDTSPFPVTLSSVSVDAPPAPLQLGLHHPIPGGSPAGCGGGAANHGFFVVGLIHALAPAADIRLIRVLDDAAQGNLFTLVAALYAFISELPPQKRGVINLSLGMHGSDEAGVVDWDGPDLLRRALRRAYEMNIVIVAAAGNENATSDVDLPAAFPARWPFVVGVAASDSKKQRACFSNRGDVMAPGGAGLKNCQFPAGRCHDEDCPYAVISLDVGSYTGYSYGVGTSFAAPLVAGLAARLQAWMQMHATGLSGPAAVSQAIIERIADSAAATGVIDLQAV